MKATCYIPAFNNSDDVRRSVASARDWRIVISDNASDQPHRESLEALAGPTVTVIRHDESLGRVGNWAFCVDHFIASGADWLKWLFAGDRLFPTAWAAYEKAMAAQPEARYLLGQFEFVYPDSRVPWNQLHGLVHPPDAMRLIAREGGHVCGGVLPAILHRDCVLDGYTFGGGLLRWAADMQFMTDIARRFPVYFMPDLIGEFNTQCRQFFKAKLFSLDCYLEDAMVRMQAAEHYWTMTGDRQGRDDLVVHIVNTLRASLHGSDTQLVR